MTRQAILGLALEVYIGTCAIRGLRCNRDYPVFHIDVKNRKYMVDMELKLVWGTAVVVNLGKDRL